MCSRLAPLNLDAQPLATQGVASFLAWDCKNRAAADFLSLRMATVPDSVPLFGNLFQSPSDSVSWLSLACFPAML